MKPAAWGCALLLLQHNRSGRAENLPAAPFIRVMMGSGSPSRIFFIHTHRARGSIKKSLLFPISDLHIPDFVLNYYQSDREVVPRRLRFLWCWHYPRWCQTPIYHYFPFSLLPPHIFLTPSFFRFCHQCIKVTGIISNTKNICSHFNFPAS